MNMRLKLVTSVWVAAAMGWLGQSGAMAQEAPALDLASVAAPGGMPKLTFMNPDGTGVHMLPTVAGAAQRTVINTDTGPLLYHSGGSIMPAMNIVNIFWIPPALQNGAATQLPSEYKKILNALVESYPGHAYGNNDTQYYQTISSTTTYIQNTGALVAEVIDRNPYPASGCTDSFVPTPSNCITDAQIQAKVKAVITANGLTPDISTIFMLYTSSDEGSCFDSSSSSCAYTAYCAYHGNTTMGSTPVIYGNMPYANLSVCQEPGEPTPNSDALADAEASIASHEITEAITDPLLNAWFTAGGSEIGDLCAYNYGSTPYPWDSGKANQFWPVANISYFLLQQMWDNHKNACELIGP